MARGWKALLTAAVVLAGSPQLAAAKATATPSAQPPAGHVTSSGAPHAATGDQPVPPTGPGQPVAHSRRAEREAKRAARQLQRQMRRQEQQEGAPQQAAPDSD